MRNSLPPPAPQALLMYRKWIHFIVVTNDYNIMRYLYFIHYIGVYACVLCILC